MKSQPSIPDDGGLRFFGTVTASVSHEIKNVLAVINEISGLFEDIPMMVAKGRPLDPERLANLTARMKAQIRRGDEIVKNLNRFAHSTDHSWTTVDINEMVELTVRLAQRLGAMRSVAITCYPPAKPVRLTTSAFFAENLLWRCLDHATAAAGSGGQVALSVEGDSAEARVRCRIASSGGGKKVDAPFPGDGDTPLLAHLNASVDSDSKAGEITLVLPGRQGNA